MSIRGTRTAAKKAKEKIMSAPPKTAAKTKKKRKKKVPELSKAAAAAIQRGYGEIGEDPAFTMRDHKAAGTQEYSHALVLNGHEYNIMHDGATGHLPHGRVVSGGRVNRLRGAALCCHLGMSTSTTVVT